MGSTPCPARTTSLQPAKTLPAPPGNFTRASGCRSLGGNSRYGAASRAPLIRAVSTTDNTRCFKYNIQRMAWSPTEALLATASGVAVRLWNVPDKESVSFVDPPCSTIQYEKSSEGDVTDSRFSKDGKLLLAVREKGWEAISVEKKASDSFLPG